jgi:ribosomal protein L37AE/L43A
MNKYGMKTEQTKAKEQTKVKEQEPRKCGICRGTAIEVVRTYKEILWKCSKCSRTFAEEIL